MIDRVINSVIVVLGIGLFIVLVVIALRSDPTPSVENFYVCGSNYEDNHLVKLPTGYDKVITIVYNIDTVICNKVEGFLEWKDYNESNASN